MSAYVLQRESFVAIAMFIARCAESGPIGDRWIHVCHPDVQALKAGGYYLTAAEAVNILIEGNGESVGYRYNELPTLLPPITQRDLFPGAAVPRGVEMFGILRSLQYQSCEKPDYRESAAYAVLISVLWLAGNKAAEQAGAETWA